MQRRWREAGWGGVTRTGAPVRMDDGLLVLALGAGVSGKDRVHAELQHRLEGRDPGHGDGGGALAGGGGGGGLERLRTGLRALLGLPGQLEQLSRGGGVVKTGPEQGRRGRGAKTGVRRGVTRGQGGQVTEILGKHPQTENKLVRAIKAKCSSLLSGFSCAF